MEITLTVIAIGSLLQIGVIALTVVLLDTRKIRLSIKKKLNRREKQKSLERARFVKDIRHEVRKYLEELQKE